MPEIASVQVLSLEFSAIDVFAGHGVKPPAESDPHKASVSVTNEPEVLSDCQHQQEQNREEQHSCSKILSPHQPPHSPASVVPALVLSRKYTQVYVKDRAVAVKGMGPCGKVRDVENGSVSPSMRRPVTVKVVLFLPKGSLCL